MRTTLLSMLQELQHYKRNKQELIEQLVAERLNKSFSVYNEELQHSIEFLTRKHEKSIVKRMNK